MELERRKEGWLATVPVARPRWLVPPLSWVLPFSPHRRVQLDGPGSSVLDLCDGQRTVEQIIETFARDNRLTFREGQLAVTQFLRELVRRGMVVLVETPGAG
jgi:hypothetical protein